MLQAVDVAGPWQWRWLLTDESTGQPVADHRVQLDPASEQVVAFSDLYGYARSHAAPDRRVPDEARIVAQAGAWAGRVLLGEPVGAAIVAAAPVTVRVSVPPQVQPVALWPLELAHAGGWPLAARGDVTLVYDVAQEPDGAGRPKDPVAGALRVLAVFSQPTRTGVVALRRARYALGRLIRQVAARQRGLVELRVVQYGVTRERLAGIVDSGDGWDVLQLWGHGGRGLFLLEHADGSPDPVDTADLVKLLRPSRRRVKLAVVSACESAADVTAETLRLVGLVPQAERLEREQVPPGPEMLGVAQAVAGELDCAVVGMRYPVTDEFAIAFGDLFYEHLLVRGQPVDVAAARAVAEAAGSGEGAASAARPAVSVATPGVFGRRAAGLRLTVPRGTPLLNPNDAGMPYFPPEPARFVGRAQAMAQASMALAPGSGRTAVLLHGMAGAGKTACALELAYRHQDAFGAVAFWQAPTRDDEFAGAMVRLAESLEIQLGDYGFTMTGHIGTVPALEAFLPRLRRVLETSGVLLVLDNLETLLTPEGTWRDPRWKPLVAALTGHGGESRLLLTSRIQPAGLDAQLAAAEAAAAGQGLEAFFRDGASRLDPDQFLAALTRWTTTALTVLPPPARLLAEFLACMEDDDRQSGIIKANWADLWRRLDRPGDPPEPGPLLEALAAAALIQPQAPPAAASDVAPPADSAPADSVPASPADSVPASPVTYRMHPGVAAAIAAAAGEGIRAAADTELAAYWQAVAGQAQEREGGEDSGLVVRAGLGSRALPAAPPRLGHRRRPARRRHRAG